MNANEKDLPKSVQLNSYVPDKFIPLFIKNKDGPGYHRITPDEIQALKNDENGAYYTGEGIDYDKIYKYVDFNKNDLKQLKGGSILGIIGSIIPKALDFAKNMIEKHTTINQWERTRPGRGRGGVYDGEGFKHSDLYDNKKYALDVNYNGFGVSGCGGTYFNNNYNPSFPSNPFSIGW